MAMKGLITNSLGKTEEAFAIAKEALRYDMKSHVCWHVYGLLYRAEKNFEEAIKAYKMALRFEPESQQILRDLALLQIQMRNYEGYVETRKTILQTRPQLRQNWTAVAIAHHLAGHYEEAEKVLVKYEETLQGNAPKWDIEHWEAALYKNRIIAESGDVKRALDHLESISKGCLDKVALRESRADYLLRLDDTEEAEKAYRVLLDRNPENRAYYAGLEAALGIDPENRKEAKEIYDEYAAKHERADGPRRIPLDFLEGEDFKKAADTYLQAKLRKGVPSTFANIKALYSDTAKRETIFALVSSYYEDQEKESKEQNGTTSPTNFRLWTIYFLAQHHDHYRTRNMDKALEFLNKGLELSPYTVEYHMTVARVYKHAGDLQTAMEKMNEARNLDKSDRYINTKTAKYQLRNDCNDDALKTMSLFTRNEAVGGPLGDLLEMQCVWYVTEDAESYARRNQLGLALKRYQALWDIFEVWTEDQFDFHSFSLRKGQIRAYVDMLKWEDTLRSHPMFSRAALGAIKTYIKLYETPCLSQGAMANGEAAKYESMTEAERKRAMKKARKEAQKAQDKSAALAVTKKDEKNKNAQVAEGEIKKEDTDPHGIALARTETPLEEAVRWLKPLLANAPEHIESQLAAFEVELRRRKWSLALQAVSKSKELAPEDPRVHEIIVRFRHAINTLPVDEAFKAPETREALLAEAEKVLAKDTDLSKYNDQFLEKNKNSAAHIRSGEPCR